MPCGSRYSTVRLVIVVILILMDNQRMGTLILLATEAPHKGNIIPNVHHSVDHDFLENHKDPGSGSGSGEITARGRTRQSIACSNVSKEDKGGGPADDFTGRHFKTWSMRWTLGGAVGRSSKSSLSRAWQWSKWLREICAPNGDIQGHSSRILVKRPGRQRTNRLRTILSIELNMLKSYLNAISVSKLAIVCIRGALYQARFNCHLILYWIMMLVLSKPQFFLCKHSVFFDQKNV